MSLRALLDRIEPKFRKGRALHALYPVYEAIDTALYSPGLTTGGPAHVRDGIDLKRIMITVWMAAWIPAIVGMFIIGLKSNEAMQVAGLTATEGWRGLFLNALIDYNPASIWDNFVHGLFYFMPIYIVTFVAGIAVEALFASKRNHEINEGFFVTSILYSLTLPATTPLWMVALGIIFGVLIGKEVFGGTGKNFLNPALVGRAFLYFAYPASMSGVAVWIPVDGYSGATALGLAAEGSGYGVTWMNAFLGNMDGSIGETSTLAILLGAAWLLLTRIASWRVMAGCLAGMILMSSIFNFIGSESNPMFSIPWYWHLVMGGFAFGAVYMATDPVSAAMTNRGRWYYGILIGAFCVLIRVVNPAFPEGMMLAILFGNLFAPLCDHLVIRANIKRRLARGG